MKPPRPSWPPESCLTVDQAARLLRRHPEQVRRYLREGRFAGAAKVGLMWYIPRAELVTFAARLRDLRPESRLGKGA